MADYTNFQFAIDDGVAIATWDMADKSMNVIDEAVMAELDAIVDAVVADDSIKGCVITSGKDGSFSGGADLSMLERLLTQFQREARGDEEAANARLLQEAGRLGALFRKLETCGKPFVGAANGTALGGAFELLLACHGRIAAKNPKAQFGLPEIQVGLFPGAGGSQRLPRLVPAQDALQMMLTAQKLKVEQALAKGLIHMVVEPDALVSTAAQFIREGKVSSQQPWDMEGYKLPAGSRIYSGAGMQVWPAANAIMRRETQNNYPAARHLLSACYEGLLVDMDTALRIEARHFAAVLKTREAAAMIRTLFLSMQELNKGARRPADVAPTSVGRVGIVGAGFMGAGIANVTAQAGIDVVLVDRDQASADKGRGIIEASLGDRVKKARMTGAKRDEVLARVTATDDYARLEGCDLVIEAVFEDPKLKAEITRQVEAIIGPDAINASNTSTLPITGLAKASQRPENFIGIHFFSPVEKMMLVEIIVGEKTGDKALATAMDYVRMIKKTPIVVQDARGFFANRCVLNYVAEGHEMFLEGVPPAMIENVGRMAGMPVGPLSLNDEVALDLGLKIMRATEVQLGEGSVDPRQKQLLETLVEKEGRLGRKNKKGFYDYPAEGQSGGASQKNAKSLWPGLKDLQPTHLDPDEIDVEELKHRFLVIQAVEAARVVEDGVITDPREADVGAILGFGFAPFTGGPLSYIDGMGAESFVALCEDLAAKHGPRFEPPQLLKDMAASGETFYTRFAPPKMAA